NVEPNARPASTVPVIVTVALAPTASVATSHSTSFPPTAHVRSALVAATAAMLAGTTSATCTEVAANGPLLMSVTVYVTPVPATTGSGLAIFSIDRSACGWLLLVNDDVLSPGFDSNVSDATVAVFVTSVPGKSAGTSIVIVTVTESPTPTSPI